MKTENQISQMRKGVLELCILSIVAKKDVYASDIIEQLKASQLIVVEGTLYPLLTRLKNEGYTSYRWEESRSGPPRKYFQITDLGKKVLSGLTNDWQMLINSVNSIVEL
jgi:PadR family transcriptional regulator, regulatory protein PadR